MIPYLMMLGLSGVLALSGMRRAGLAFALLALVYWLMIGFRFQVGMDWDNYIHIYSTAKDRSLSSLLFQKEPGFQLLMWFAARTGGGYPLINAVAGLVFCWGFFSVAKRCSDPFLAVVVATPLLVVAFAMSGTRQSMAMGIIFYLYATWERRSLLGRIALVFAASLFHFSAVFVLIFVALAARVGLVAKVAAVGGAVALLLLVIYFVPDAIEAYGELYVSSEGRRLEAPGAIAQVGVIAVVALAYFVVRRSWIQRLGRNSLYENLAVAALLALPAISISSVGAYRFALYLWPMAMYVASGMLALIATPAGRVGYRLLVVLASGALLAGWLTFSNNGWAWLPYENWLLQPDGVRLRR